MYTPPPPQVSENGITKEYSCTQPPFPISRRQFLLSYDSIQAKEHSHDHPTAQSFDESQHFSKSQLRRIHAQHVAL